jgi:precorrin-8X/cobalt-precorrin-8 methylmutase
VKEVARMRSTRLPASGGVAQNTYLTDPHQLEAQSLEHIVTGLKSHHLTDAELAVVTRVIHITGDFEYQDLIAISPGALESAIVALEGGCRIVTDTRMALAGINKSLADHLHCRLDCYLDTEEVFQLAAERGITRSMAALEVAARHEIDIFVIGNAPTALSHLAELIQQTQLTPELIIGVPVGFVGAAEAKAQVRSMPIPSITTIGTKGGSNVAAAIMNALLHMAAGQPNISAGGN